jgi:hypothetical protein
LQKFPQAFIWEKNTMISANLNIVEFIENLKTEDYLSIIYLSNQEATEVERRVLRGKSANPGRNRDYVRNLKNFIFFMRYGYKPFSIDTEHYNLFIKVRERVW